MKCNQPTLTEWRLFLASVELGSFAAAARKFKTDPAYVGRAVSRLESHFDTTLLVRTKTGVKATWSGDYRYREMKPIVERLDALFDGLSVEQGRNTIRVAVPFDLSPLFVRWCTEFETTSTEAVNIKLVQYESGRMPAPSGFDLVICTRELPIARVFAQKIGVMRKGLAASQAFMNCRDNPKAPEDIKPDELIAGKGHVILTNGLRTLSIAVERRQDSGSVMQLIEAAKAGRGIAADIPLWVLTDPSMGNGLCRVLPQWFCPDESVWLLRSERDWPDKKVKRLVDYLRSAWADTPGLNH